MHVCAKFGPDRTAGDDVYTVGRIHTHTDTHTLSYIDIDVWTHVGFVNSDIKISYTLCYGIHTCLY